MNTSFFNTQLQQRFGNQKLISREELFDFYKHFEPDLKESTFGWRIYALKEKNILRPVRTGLYTMSAKSAFHPQIDPELTEMSNRIAEHFKEAKYCVWNTRWLNDWMVHQPGRFLSIVEMETNVVESVFYFLKDNGYKNIYLNPDEGVMERYVYDEQETTIVKTLITKSPLKKENKIPIPSLEKILVDIFVDKKIFSPFQGSEMTKIFDNVFKRYQLNISKLLAYAKRRSKEQELLDYINTKTQITELLQE